MPGIIFGVLAHAAYGVVLSLRALGPVTTGVPDAALVPFFWLTSLLLFLSLPLLQGLFERAPDRKILDQLGEPGASIVPIRFRTVAGIRRPHRYLLPFLCYWLFLSYTIYFFVPWIAFGGVAFGYRTGSILIGLLFWAILAAIALIYLSVHFTRLSAYLEIHGRVLVVRAGLTTHHLTLESITKLRYFTRPGKLMRIEFETTEGTTIKLPVTHLSAWEELQKTLELVLDAESSTHKIQRSSHHSRVGIRSGPGRARGRSSRW